MISEAINDLSDLSHSLSSEIILNNGLIKALEFEMEQLKKSDIYRTGFSITGSPVFLDADAELVIFRIVQEALNNIMKHAAATKIDIHLHYNTHVLLLEINDNGRGFYTGKSYTGTGLQNLKKRATALKGNLSVNSTINIGTSIKIEIPLYANKETGV
jgi:two-component system NarL family sensor kinase